MYRKTIYLMLVMLVFLMTTTATAAGSQPLEEGWLFYNEQLITTTQPQGVLVDLPVSLQELTGEVSGYGTFVKAIKKPNESQMGLYVPFIHSAAKVYVNGQLVQQIGQVGTDGDTHESDLKPVVIPISSQAERLEIAIQISSFDQIRSGFSNAPVIGDWDTVHNGFMRERYHQVFTDGFIFVAGIMTIIISLLNREQKILLIFGVFSVAISMRGFFAEPFVYHQLQMDISYIFATRMEYLMTIIAFIFYAIFIYLLYKKIYAKTVLYVVVLALVAIGVFILVTDDYMYQRVFYSVFPLVILYVIYNVWIMIKAIRIGKQLAGPLLLGIVFVFIGLIVDYLTGMGAINAPPIAHFTIAINVVLVIISLLILYVKQLNYVTELNEQLDEAVKKRTVELAQVNEELSRIVNIDALTGCFNRYRFNEAITQCFRESVDQQQPLGLIMVDIDEFKQYNDFYGHVQGDELLKQIVDIIQQTLPDDTLLARYGGEEFVVIFPNYTKTQVIKIGKKLVEEVAELKIVHLSRKEQIITISAGCAERMTDGIQSEIDLVRMADLRLYTSKENGRNQLTSE